MKWKKKILAALTTGVLAMTPFPAQATPGNPTCILMKFTDDTRYDRIESAASLSDLMMEKMVASGRFNLKETRPIDENMEAMLYDEKVQDLVALREAAGKGDFNTLFEGEGFRENKAQTIASAAVGQIVTPSITAAIGEAHGAQYLVQGTIVNIGVGNWWMDTDYAMLSQAINSVSSLVAAPFSAALGGQFGSLGALVGGFGIRRTGIGVQCDIRVIRADTGEVIWNRRIKGIDSQRQIGVGFLRAGSAKLNANLYAKAMDKAAQAAVDALIADMDAGLLFRK